MLTEFQGFPFILGLRMQVLLLGVSVHIARVLLNGASQRCCLLERLLVFLLVSREGNR